MVPFSFPEPLLKSQVMKERSLPFLVAHEVWNQVLLPFPAFLLSLWSFRPVREKPRNPAKSNLITPNQSKSNLFFLFQLLTPKFWLLNSGVPGVNHRPSRWFMADQRKAKLPNEPNLKMSFSSKTLAISRFNPFSKQVKSGKKSVNFVLFHAISGRLWGIYRSETAILRLWPSVVKKLGPASRWLKTQKRLNEPNLKNANHPINIDDLTDFDFFKK
jgi:hypothetical protein